MVRPKKLKQKWVGCSISLEYTCVPCPKKMQCIRLRCTGCSPALLYNTDNWCRVAVPKPEDLPDVSIELTADGKHMFVQLTEEEFEERNGSGGSLVIQPVRMTVKVSDLTKTQKSYRYKKQKWGRDIEEDDVQQEQDMVTFSPRRFHVALHLGSPNCPRTSQVPIGLCYAHVCVLGAQLTSHASLTREYYLSSLSSSTMLVILWPRGFQWVLFLGNGLSLVLHLISRITYNADHAVSYDCSGTHCCAAAFFFLGWKIVRPSGIVPKYQFSRDKCRLLLFAPELLSKKPAKISDCSSYVGWIPSFHFYLHGVTTNKNQGFAVHLPTGLAVRW